MRPDLNKIWVVASTEFGTSIRTKSFLVGLLILPIIMGLSIGLQLFVAKQVDTRTRTFAVVDRTGELYPAIERAAEAYNEQAVDAQGPVDPPRGWRCRGRRGRPDAAAELELSDKVRRGRARRLRGDPGRGDRAAGARGRRAPGAGIPLRQPQRRRRSATGWPRRSTPRSARDGSARPAWTRPWPID